MKGARKQIIIVSISVIVIAGIIYLLTIFTKNGFGPGLADYSYKIANICDLRRSSASVVAIGCDGLNEGVPPDVIGVGWDDNYLVAETHPIPGYPQSYSNPDTSVTDWWVVDLKNKSRLGPWSSEQQYEAEKKQLNIGSIELVSPALAKDKGEKENY